MNAAGPEQFPPNDRGARLIEVIEVITKEGDNAHGTLVREVTRYYTLDGELLATRDVDDPTLATLNLGASTLRFHAGDFSRWEVDDAFCGHEQDGYRCVLNTGHEGKHANNLVGCFWS